jgi:hypothetical protein
MISLELLTRSVWIWCFQRYTDASSFLVTVLASVCALTTVRVDVAFISVGLKVLDCISTRIRSGSLGELGNRWLLKATFVRCRVNMRMRRMVVNVAVDSLWQVPVSANIWTRARVATVGGAGLRRGPRIVRRKFTLGSFIGGLYLGRAFFLTSRRVVSPTRLLLRAMFECLMMLNLLQPFNH